MLNRLFGTQCLRPGCGHHNPKDSEFCEKCGISLGFSRPAILDGNTWSAAPDELAVFFRFKRMKGFFTRTLHVPAGMKAMVLQGDDADSPELQLDAGEHTVATLYQRMNNFFLSPHGEVLVFRTEALPVTLQFNDVLSAELLPMQVAATLLLRLGDAHNLRRSFMKVDGAVSTSDLQQILRGPVRQGLAEVVGARHVDEMAADPEFRDKLNAGLCKTLQPALDNLGLRLHQVTALSLSHEALDAQNQLKGRLWLVRREGQLKEEHDKALADLYDQREWQTIREREQGLRRREKAGQLTHEEADLACTLRLREVEQLERILQAQTREQAASLGAADEVTALEHKYGDARRQRAHQALGNSHRDDSEVESWKHLQAVARVRLDGERRAAQVRADSMASFEAERISGELERMRIEAQLSHARLLDNAASRQQAEQALQQEEQEREGLLRDLARRQQQAVLADLDLGVDARRREAERVHALEDELLRTKVRKIKSEDDAAASAMSAERTQRLAARLDAIESKEREDEMLRDRMKFEQAQAAADAAHAHQLKLLADQRHSDRQTAEDDRARLAVLGSLPEEALASLTAAGANVGAIVELARIKAYKGMSSDQIVAAQSGLAFRAAAPAGGMDTTIVQAMVGEIGTLMAELRQGDNAVAGTATDHLIRAHEGSRADLVEAMRILRDVSNGRQEAAAAMPAAVSIASPGPAAMSRPAEPQPAWASPQPAPSANCPQCRAPVNVYQHYCTRCGTAVLAGQPPGHRAAAPSEGAGLRKCPRCGEWGAQGMRYCGCCCHAFRA